LTGPQYFGTETLKLNGPQQSVAEEQQAKSSKQKS
jgi:hypothetical protein